MEAVTSAYPWAGPVMIVIKADNGLNVIYQEFATSASDCYVTQGQRVTAGQALTKLQSHHLHLGITSQYYATAISNSYSSAGGWIDPIAYIQQHS